ncbi:HEAT repeat domain-containing protein [Streptomyces sp. NPDC007856]|uniref:HEAT repeat domain-containing protein n=1 Tax=Streptomyces sp. NPDC007856 TaxID=3364781 RepID=UPI0036C6F8E5
MTNQESSGSGPRLDYANFLQRQAREAGLGARDISERFARAREVQDAKAAKADNGSRPEPPISTMACSKSHIGRLLKAQALPSPLWPFTLQFLRITNRAAGLSAEEHRKRCIQARVLVNAIQDAPQPQITRTPARSDNTTAGDNTPEETIATLRLEVDLERARHTETRLRYALRDSQVLMATLWNIISALRDIISSHHALEARVYHTSGDPAELARLRSETQQALAHKRTGHEEAYRVAARMRRLEESWERARAELHRLSLDPGAFDLVPLPCDHALSPQPVLPQDLLASSVLDDIAAALNKAKSLNDQEELEACALQQTLMPTDPLQSEDELAILVAATHLTSVNNRRMALDGLLRDWPNQPETRDALFRLTNDDDAGIRARAVQALSENWPDHPDVGELTLRIVRDDHDRVRKSATRGLARVYPGDAVARDILIRLAKNDRYYGVRCSAVDGLAKSWPGDSEVAKELLVLTRDEHARVRKTAVCALATGWPNDAGIAETLVKLTFDFSSDGVRDSARAGLRAAWPRAAAVREVLHRLARSNRYPHRGLAASLWGDLGRGYTEAREVLVHLTFDEHPSVRREALFEFFENWLYDPIVPDVLLRLTTDPDERIRKTASEWLRSGRGLWPHADAST